MRDIDTSAISRGEKVASPSFVSASDTVTREEVDQLLNYARSTISHERNRLLLERALEKCEILANVNKEEGTILKAITLAELAIEDSIPANRGRRWREAISLLASSLGTNSASIDCYASLAVDSFQDSLSDLEASERIKGLRIARDTISSAIGREVGVASAMLLARKSSVLRQLARVEFSDFARRDLLEESLRCASRSVAESRTASALLECAESQWAVARHQASDEQYIDALRKAEYLFKQSVAMSFEPARLALARFYRMTYRQLDCCSAFPRSFADSKNPRRMLRESSIYAEAAIQLWYSQYPDEVVKDYLLDAQKLVEAAVGAGYRNARHITNLAFLRAILNGPEAGDLTLSMIVNSDGTISWSKVMERVSDKTVMDLITTGLSAGIHLASVWTLLGTYVLQFKEDYQLAELLYRTAVRLDGHNPIALTNLARLLLRRESIGNLREARRLLSTARQFSDRRFTWWREVQTELEAKTTSPAISLPSPDLSVSKRALPLEHYESLKQLRRQFKSVEELQMVQERGYALEKLFYELARLTVPIAFPSYRYQRSNHGSIQVDSYFEIGVDKYRVECKWQRNPANHVDVSAFLAKLDVAGISGLFVSMTGFTSSAIDQAKLARPNRAIIFMDGDEVRAVLKNLINFDEAIRKKRLFLDQRSDPYYKVTTPEKAIS